MEGSVDEGPRATMLRLLLCCAPRANLGEHELSYLIEELNCIAEESRGNWVSSLHLACEYQQESLV